MVLSWCDIGNTPNVVKSHRHALHIARALRSYIELVERKCARRGIRGSSNWLQHNFNLLMNFDYMYPIDRGVNDFSLR